MITGKTQTGFEFELDESTVNDIELFELLTEVDENPMLFPKTITKLLGDKQKKRLYEHCRSEKGNVPIDAIAQEIEDIFSGAQELKNS